MRPMAETTESPASGLNFLSDSPCLVTTAVWPTPIWLTRLEEIAVTPEIVYPRYRTVWVAFSCSPTLPGAMDAV